MRIRRFKARDMSQALRLVRQTLGPEAVILETKAIREGRSSQEGVMVLAAVDRHPGIRPEGPPSFNQGGALRWDTEAPSATRGSGLEPVAPAPRTTIPVGGKAPALGHPPGRLEQEIKRLQGRVFYLNRLIVSDHFSAIPVPLRELYLGLVEAEVDSNLAFSILREVAELHPSDILSGPQLAPLRERLLHLMPRGQGIPASRGRRIALLVGPPGSGKTTVAASLAARCLRAGRRPGLISLDSFRVGGSTGLEDYARILEVPFAAVFEPDDLLESAARDLADCDVIIVDTPGFTYQQRETAHLVRRFQSRLVSPKAHLVLAATSKVGDSADALALFSQFDPSSLIFTRIDETNSYGGIISLSLKSRLPVIHLNCGRQLLEDLRDPTPEALVSMVLRRCVTTWEPPPAPARAAPGAAASGNPAATSGRTGDPRPARGSYHDPALAG